MQYYLSWKMAGIRLIKMIDYYSVFVVDFLPEIFFFLVDCCLVSVHYRLPVLLVSLLHRLLVSVLLVSVLYRLLVSVLLRVHVYVRYRLMFP